MGKHKTLRLGTRRSALAWVQSSQVAAALRAAHPGLEVELVGIETRGDRVLDKPLSQIEGKEFFTAELDHALAAGDVDFTVHSLKDLALERPPGFVLAAVPRRANPRDLALFAPDVPELLAGGGSLRVGTSSPRRAQLLPGFFARALPHAARGRVMLENLRGNVDSRLRRLHEPRGSERQLDGVVLAMAGLSRLYADTSTERQGRALLSSLLEGLNLMVLPLSESPGAPGQGALAVECRAADSGTRALLGMLEDPATRGAVALERALLAEHGGGCHQRFGATFSWMPGLGGLMRVAGRNASDLDIAERRYLPNIPLPAITGTVREWDGSQAHKTEATPLLDGPALASRLKHEAVFVAHSRALPAGGAPALAGKKVWTSGTSSWFALAAQGVWVQGCSEGQGAEAAAQFIAEPLLRLPPPSRWDTLTHAAATEPWQAGSWAGANVIATYQLSESELPERETLTSATHLFWSSTAQFERGRHFTNPEAWHSSGPGKTAEHIRGSGVRNCLAFPSPEEWRKWTARAR